MKKYRILIIIVIISIIFLSNIDKKTLNEELIKENTYFSYKNFENIGPNLSYNPISHDFKNMYESEYNETTFEIWNSGCCYLSYRITEQCNWLEISPTSGGSSGEHDKINIFIDTSNLNSGFHQCDIKIDSNAGIKYFTVYVNITEANEPVLTFYPKSYDLGELPKGETYNYEFSVWNCGTNTLTYNIENSQEWVYIHPIDGQSTGEQDTIYINLDTKAAPLGFHNCPIYINTNSNDEIFNLKINLIPPNEPILNVNPDNLDFGYSLINQKYNKTFEITNTGTGQLIYNINEDLPWINIEPTAGTIDTETDTIEVQINTTELETGLHEENIAITSNGGNKQFSIIVNVTEGYSDITVEEAYILLTDTTNGIQIPIDVRTDPEWAEGHIDTSEPENPRHHCVCEWNETIIQNIKTTYKDEIIILYCQGGTRSAIAANTLVNNDFQGVIYNMLGGINQWKNMGYPTKTNTAPEKPEIKGPEIFKQNIQQEFEITVKDNDLDDIYININWGDENQETLGPYDSDDTIKLRHTWSGKGNYTIEITANDKYQAESETKSYDIISCNYPMLYRIINWLSKILPILENILAYL